jgi:NAD(P)-dependent dehydrogenase (short-subunit alcohol dehydrogenase family)
MRNFKGRVAVVTGGASGIGRGMAERFGAEGMRVVLADVEEQALRQTEADLREKGIEVLGVRTDVSKPEDIEKLAEKTLQAFGAAHLLCNNAGVAGTLGPIVSDTLKDWEWVMGVNLWGVIHGVRVFLPIMLRQGEEGHIVNTASLAGLMAGRGIYGVTKQAVVALSESLYNELKLAESKIGVSVLCPGWVNTKIADSARNRPPGLANPTEPGPDALRNATAQAVRDFLANGKSPAEIADLVWKAIRDEKLYVITHEEMDGLIKERFDNILARTNPTPRVIG